MLKVLVSVFLVLVLTSGSLAGRRGKWKGRRGCGRSEERVGQHFKWTVTGLDSDDLRVSYGEGAFAPVNSTVVHKYPLDRGQRALGVVPAKIFYDFSGPDPVAVLKMGKRGTGACIVVSADVDTYDELITVMQERNMSNTDMPTEEEAVRLTATLTTDDLQFSDTVRDLCSKDKCGRTVEPVYYVTELAAGQSLCWGIGGGGGR
ncbi:uncharacterized protein [Littorina saxatilis]|uniref:Uncharacterized protein n=1 Tax=Littorina saxatilis TaxID=31220 RepID=A0AAN9AL27_9CAEN